MKRVLALLAFVGSLSAPAAAQRVATGVSLDTIRVGDAFRAIARINVQPGMDVLMPDSLPAAADIENTGRVRTQRDSTAQGVSVILAYPLVAWRPGEVALPSFNVLLRTAARERNVTIDLPAISVVSVLPADTTNIQAKPPKDVFGGNRLWWPWLLAALLLLAALAAAYWWWRRRRLAQPLAAPVPIVMPRARALEELERIQKLGLIEKGEYKRFYTLLSEILRRYLESYDSTWSGDLTTDELAQRVKPERDVAPAISVLRSADLVKFAQGASTPRDANADWKKAHEWLTGFRAETPAQLEAA